MEFSSEKFSFYMKLSQIDFRTLIAFSGIFLFLFLIAEFAYRIGRVKVDYTRKFVHIMTGIIVMFFPVYFKNPLDLIIICGSFFLVLLITKRIGLMPSINAIDRESKGSILYPIVVIICYFIQFWEEAYVYFFIPILILGLADPAAEFAGKKLQYKPYSIFGNSKTISGSFGFFFIALLVSYFGLHFFTELRLFGIITCAMLIAVVTTIGEAISVEGYDNLIIPLSTVLVLFLFSI